MQAPPVQVARPEHVRAQTSSVHLMDWQAPQYRASKAAPKPMLHWLAPAQVPSGWRQYADAELQAQAPGCRGQATAIPVA